ncbi:hypothetical protein INT44_007053 [Umbelopsis vinacea]|uniref:Uncharacterized protein n=1 Tax=Umbelopsis vinacea TaxID=44442 RepID=A0A8H7PG57_9FUNG|nr:hypothetical protein INT44_007053 [Umbelopsis vinacea]
MSTSPELRVTALQDCNVPLMSPLPAPSGPATGSLTPKRRKLPLKTVVDPTEASWKDDIENQYNASHNVIFSSTKKQPLSMGTPVASNSITGRRDMRRPSQSLVARLGAAVSSPNFDISRHSIIPDLMPSAHRNMPLTPRSAARRVRFLDMEEQSPPQDEFLHALFPEESSTISHSSDEEEVNNEEQENPFEVVNDVDDIVSNDVQKPENTVVKESQPLEETLSDISRAQNANKDSHEKLLYVDVSDDNVSDGENTSDLPENANAASKDEHEYSSRGNVQLETVEQEDQTPKQQENEQSKEKPVEPVEVLASITDTTQHQAQSSSDSDSDSSSGSSDDMESDLLALLNDRETLLARQTKAAEQALPDQGHSENTLTTSLKITSPKKAVKKVLPGKKPIGPLKTHSHNRPGPPMKVGSHNKSKSPPKPTNHYRAPYSLPSATWEVNVRRGEESGSSKENAAWVGHQRHRKSLLRKERNSLTQWIVEDASVDSRERRKLSTKRKREPSVARQLR